MKHAITPRKALLLAALPISAALLSASPASAAKLVKGTVVHRNPRARSFVVAGRGGRLTPVHAAHSPAIGRTVAVSVRKLANGTFALRHLRALGVQRRVHARGVVTYVDRRKATFTLSAEGVSMLVRRGVRRAATDASALPGVGTKVSVTGVLGEGGTIDAQTVTDDGPDHGAIALEGSVTAIDSAARTLGISAEDNALSGQSVTVSVPIAFDLTKFAIGQEVQLRVTLLPDGTYQLAGSSSDEGAKGAEDRTDEQGEGTEAGDSEDQADTGSEGGASDHQAASDETDHGESSDGSSPESAGTHSAGG